MIVLAACMFSVVYSQSAKSIIKEFKKFEDAEYVHMPRMVMSLCPSSVKDGVQGVRSLSVLDMDDCSDDVKTLFVSVYKRKD